MSPDTQNSSGNSPQQGFTVDMATAGGTPVPQPVRQGPVPQNLQQAQAVDMASNPELQKLMIDTARSHGFEEFACRLEGKAFEKNLSTRFGMAMNYRPKVKDLVVFAVGVGVVVAVYAGVAYYFDLPFFGHHFKKDGAVAGTSMEKVTVKKI